VAETAALNGNLPPGISDWRELVQERACEEENAGPNP
jgi:hypothetical protein